MTDPDHSLTLATVISVAEQALERAGHAGRAITVPTGRIDDPDYRAAIQPLTTHVRTLSGVAHLRIGVDNYTLDREGAQAYTDGLNTIGVRTHTTDMHILHEIGHIIDRSYGRDGHTTTFAHIAHDLFRQHISPQAATMFWNLIADYLDPAPTIDHPDSFGPNTPAITALIARAATLTTTEAARLDTAAPTIIDGVDLWDARDTARRTADTAGRTDALSATLHTTLHTTRTTGGTRAATDAAYALAVTDLIGHHTYTRTHHNTLTATWAATLGPTLITTD